MTEADAAPAADTPPTTTQKLLAEFLGTFVLVFIGCGAAFTTGADVVATGFAFGIAIVVMAYSFGRISGGHFNPAVSLGAALAGRISWKETGLYATVQIAGALLGGLVLALTVLASDVGWEFGDPLGSNAFGDNGGVEVGGALLIEIVLTFIFLLVILAVTDERNRAIAAQAPLAIGLALAAIHFVGINATGTSVNPARSLGVAFFSGSDAIQDVWLFLVAPLVGAAIAGVIYPLTFGRGADPVPGSGLNFGARGSSDPGFTQQWNQQAYGQQQFPQPGQTAQQVPPQQAQPIIQDGWQWDPATQQWIPAQQQPPAAPGPQGGPQGTQTGWAPPAADQTQVRPPQ